MLISVIIPTLNEEACIEETLRMLSDQPPPLEIIVADGDSLDGTRSMAAQHARVITALRGRAAQMNAGAGIASGEVLLFLHADTLLPPRGLTAIREVLSDPTVEAGAFRLRFDDESPLLRLYAACTRLPFTSFCFGDRALFARRSTFAEIGGFPDTPIFEDLEMARRLYRRGSFRFLSQAVVTSARRFRACGFFLQQLRNACLWCGHFLGICPKRLASLYDYKT